jgi:asparagine synthase (glutamine-hydrolysing)
MWNTDGRPGDPEHISKVLRILSPYARDGFTVQVEGPLTLIFGAFHTCCESRGERQPHRTAAGDTLLRDGRLDNREDLFARTEAGRSDLEIVAAAYERWGTGALRQLIGDWALSVWSPAARSVLLARDFAGVRPLFYAVDSHQVRWSSLLDPLVLLAGSRPALSEEYIAGWLSMLPKASLTPYAGILAVPPGAYVTVSPGKSQLQGYWEFDPGRKTRYRRDADYEEHFRSVFRQSILRRLRSSGPILAELSGGMDSSSIVCMSDRLTGEEASSAPIVDTVSYFDDQEPHWDERPYIGRVEEHRGKRGQHIDVNAPLACAAPKSRAFLPAPSYGDPDQGLGRKFSECILSGPYRVVLSGTGGDEATGGLPTPLPELADLLAQMKFAQLGRQLVRWSLARRKAALGVFFELLRAFFPRRPVPGPPWLNRNFVERNRAALAGYPERIGFWGPLPSFRMNLLAFEALRRQLSATPVPAHPHYERRYPFLDRDFLEFCYSVPREQLVRPYQRRSLMRRAMRGIVPAEILERKRKAFVVRRLLTTLEEASGRISAGKESLLSAAWGIVDRDELARVLGNVRKNHELPLVPLLRVVALEEWLGAAQPHISIQGPNFAPLPAAERSSAFLGRVHTTQKGGGNNELPKT